MSETEQAERDKALKRAYQAATSRLRTEHREDFHRLYAEEATKRGVEWTPPKTAEEKAADELRELLSRFPHLAEQVVVEEEQSWPEVPPVTDVPPVTTPLPETARPQP